MQGRVMRDRPLWYWPIMVTVSPVLLVCGLAIVVAALIAGTLLVCSALIAGAVLAPFALLTERGRNTFNRLGDIANRDKSDPQN